MLTQTLTVYQLPERAGSGPYLGPCQISMRELFAKIVNDSQLMRFKFGTTGGDLLW